MMIPATILALFAALALHPSVVRAGCEPVCGNGQIEPGEVCDCGFGFCFPDRAATDFPNRGGCPTGPDGRWTFCKPYCSGCRPAPACADGVLDPGDTCDYLSGSQSDNCAPGSICLDATPCQCSCASAGQLCIQHTTCCPPYTCIDSVCQ